MPSNVKTYSTCAGPGVAVPHTRIGGVIGTILSLWEGSTIGKILLIIAAGGLLPLILAGDICFVAPVIIIAAAEFKEWYYNRRLLCIRDRDCAIGEVIANPDTATDGDRKLNLLLAPLTLREVRTVLRGHLERNRAMLSDSANFPSDFFPPDLLVGGVVPLPSASELADPQKLKDYLKALRGRSDDEDADSDIYNQVLVGAIDTLMQTPSRRVQQRYFQKLKAVITDAATYDYIPVDLAAPDNASGSWQQPGAKCSQRFFNPPLAKAGYGLNPMFRFDNDQAAPYLHCELEGHNIALWMDQAIVAATGALIGCIAGGPAGGLLLGLIFWLLWKLFNWLFGDDDGDATDPGVAWDDPSVEEGEVHGQKGSIVAVYGNWIMDTEHYQYFEIHPVRAFYVLSSMYDLSSVDDPIVRRQCEMIRLAEETEPKGTIEQSQATLLSYGLETRYGGGGGAKIE